jgi:hypothetical protein
MLHAYGVAKELLFAVLAARIEVEVDGRLQANIER